MRRIDDAVVVPPSPAAVAELAAGRLRLRQRPGPDNALGAVKFRMPNPYNIYLHATPEQALFLRAQRRFSHGCVRVSEPAVLAEFVLHNAGTTWDAKAIKDAMDGGSTAGCSACWNRLASEYQIARRMTGKSRWTHKTTAA